jgi:hypothetical protein
MPRLHSHSCENPDYHRVPTVYQTICLLKFVDDSGKDYKGELACPITVATVGTLCLFTLEKYTGINSPP